MLSGTRQRCTCFNLAWISPSSLFGSATKTLQQRTLYVEADLTMKEQALMKLQPAGAAPGRFRASDDLMRFLKAL